MEYIGNTKAGLKLVKLLLREAFVLEAMGIMPSKDAVLAVSICFLLLISCLPIGELS